MSKTIVYSTTPYLSLSKGKDDEELGSNLITNGTFSTDGAGWGGSMVWNNSIGNPPGAMFAISAATLSQDIGSTSGTSYRVIFWTDANSGTVNVNIGGGTSIPILGNGNHSITVLAGNANTLLLFSSTSAIQIDNIICQAVL